MKMNNKCRRKLFETKILFARAKRMIKNPYKDTKALDALDEIAMLKDNWNDNGAKPFSIELIQKCICIANSLDKEPFIAPTACRSIQFEYAYLPSHIYFEFEVFEDHIKWYAIDKDEKETEGIISGVDQVGTIIIFTNSFINDNRKVDNNEEISMLYRALF